MRPQSNLLAAMWQSHSVNVQEAAFRISVVSITIVILGVLIFVSQPDRDAAWCPLAAPLIAEFVRRRSGLLAEKPRYGGASQFRWEIAASLDYGMARGAPIHGQ